MMHVSRQNLKQKIKETAKTVLLFIVNPRLLFCFALAWLITNGWAYIVLGLGTYHEIEWMIAVAGTYLAVIWLPFSPEKILTFFISLGLLHLIFPHDEKTLGILKELYAKQKEKKREKREEKRKKKEKNSDIK